MRFIYDDIIKSRADSYLSDNLEDMSRSRIQSLIKSGDITESTCHNAFHNQTMRILTAAAHIMQHVRSGINALAAP